MVKISDIEMMKNIDDKFNALLSEFQKNIDKSKILEQKAKDPNINLNPPLELSREYNDNNDSGQLLKTSLQEDTYRAELSESIPECNISTDGIAKAKDRISHKDIHDEKSSGNDNGEKPLDLRETSSNYTVGQMVDLLEQRLQITDDVSEEISLYRSGEYPTTHIRKTIVPRQRSEDLCDIQSLTSTVNRSRKKKRTKKSVQFNGASEISLLKGQNLSSASISSKKRKKKKKLTANSTARINWINHNRDNVCKYFKKKTEPDSPKGSQVKLRSKSAVPLTVTKIVSDYKDPCDDEEQKSVSERTENSGHGNKNNTLPKKHVTVNNNRSSSQIKIEGGTKLRPTKSFHNKCTSEGNLKDLDHVKQINQNEKDYFSTIPFIVGRSISKTYHIGLSFQQTMSIIKRFTSNRDMLITPLGEGDFLLPTQSAEPVQACRERRCLALENGDEGCFDEYWDENPWDLERSKQRPRCTCLPEPKKVSNVKKILKQIMSKIEPMKNTNSSALLEEEMQQQDKSLRKKQTNSRTELLRKIQSVQLLLMSSVKI